MTPTNHITVVFVGDESVGKSSLIRRLLLNKQQREEMSAESQEEDAESDQCATFYAKSVMVRGEEVRLQIWDTPGHESCECLLPLYYTPADVVVVVYEIAHEETPETSFMRARTLVHQVQSAVSGDAPSDGGPLEPSDSGCGVLLVGNKVDQQSFRKISKQKVDLWATRHNLPYLEVSSKFDLNLGQLMKMIVRSGVQHSNTVSLALSPVSPRREFSAAERSADVPMAAVVPSPYHSSSPLTISKGSPSHSPSSSPTQSPSNESTYRRQGSKTPLRPDDSSSSGAGSHEGADISWWMPDSASKECLRCGHKFNVVIRRHHCRNCGKLICSGCSTNRMSVPDKGFHERVRVCNLCYRKRKGAITKKKKWF
eukprot:TRINITY_DN909_c0_g1_i1.p1 TRINITY_DN909_c0_g1~~TRINITY_DN909_c0_g1_i1.p1  ORF type:complete len:369 (-),score=65.56 TRINITY_DN909_c0_g1_i1:51-1157(-)